MLRQNWGEQILSQWLLSDKQGPLGTRPDGESRKQRKFTYLIVYHGIRRSQR
jgi:hypothetical protein